jgi:hypothetical protein
MIARHYREAHANETVFTNSTPLQSILATLSDRGMAVDAHALDAEQGLLRPDIVNITRMHIYEIKPATAAWAGRGRVALYAGHLARAGVVLALGPSTEPGTTGAMPAPGGVFVFWSPEPGIIAYQYRRARLVRHRVRAPAGEGAWRWEWKLEPLTRAQQEQVMVATMGTALVIMMMILLLPVGA